MYYEHYLLIFGRKIIKNHKLENRCVLRQISNIYFHSWVALGSRGYREKKIQIVISMLFLRPVFYVFTVKNNNIFFTSNLMFYTDQPEKNQMYQN